MGSTRIPKRVRRGSMVHLRILSIALSEHGGRGIPVYFILTPAKHESLSPPLSANEDILGRSVNLSGAVVRQSSNGGIIQESQ